ncbi:MAG TPA: guanitoxin biosynthesis heme-dependent pre-guanitoxin N-hydroxylase GntA [Candidatus Baltobacteraceae bacterium]|jgi:hypothetical protein|nr:guanitoxin biosynthesis heme-dependent pre-guanitoxin N-hydroxylase GntA [Candidatus Baltobacteraceae bacterium]
MGGLTPEQACSLYDSTNPYQSPRARRFSNYSGHIDGALIRLLDWKRPTPQARLAHNAVRSFLQSDRFSCVAGKAAVQTGAYRFAHYPKLASIDTTAGLARDLCAFVAESESTASRYATFVAAFDDRYADDAGFEAALWRQLQALHEIDIAEYDPTVSSDPGSSRFAFSFAGRAFFVVGMHPKSSRFSRRSPLPALAFNAHDLFRLARQEARFERIQQLVRQREIALQGTINPELRQFGQASEARQYSGRHVGPQWTCPFHSKS